MLLATILSLAVLMIWQIFFMPEPSPSPLPREVSPAEIPSSIHPKNRTPSGDIGFQPLNPSEEISETESGSLPEPPIEAEEREITIETRDYSAVLSSRGAHIIHWALKEYADLTDNPLEMISSDMPSFFPGDIQIGDDVQINQTVYAADTDRDRITLDQQEPFTTVSFTTRTLDGILIQKTFTFYHDNFSIDFAVDIKNSGTQPLEQPVSVLLPDTILNHDKLPTGKSLGKTGPILMLDNKREIPKIHKYQQKWVYPTPAQWIAIQEDFFFVGLIPATGADRPFILPTRFATNNKADRASTGFQVLDQTLQPSERVNEKYYVVMGPKKFDRLEELHIGIETIVDFGWITWLGKLFYHVLIHTNRIVNSYGLSIIILTIAIKILLLYPSHSSMKSMKKMSSIQPMVREIQERYRKDRIKQQEEITKLYKKHGVNPVGGCLPMLIQFPVFIALYQVLINLIEMRHASFLWADDLSQPDIPLVLIMGVSMIVQQKMTPVSGDPRQAKMMMFMPVIFTAMFWNFPAGLVLYWLINNVLTIIQQYFMNRSSDDGKQGTERKMKSRTMKKLGSKQPSPDDVNEITTTSSPPTQITNE